MTTEEIREILNNWAKHQIGVVVNAGERAIHHPLNLAAVCGKPACNDAQNIGFNPRKRDKLIQEIRADIGWWTNDD